MVMGHIRLITCDLCCRWDEKVFGLEYDLDVFHIVAVSSFNMVRCRSMMG